jgi:hypothetical protein
MGFYYFSIFSLIPLGAAYGVLALLFWGVARMTRRLLARRVVLVAVGALFLLLPVSEELWIAWNFGQACKQAGTFIHQKVMTDGFYDATRDTHAGPRAAQAIEELDRAGFRFYEMVLRNPFGGPNRVVHLEKADGQWAATVLDRPSAKYHFRFTDPMDGTRWGHKIVRTGSIVVDSANNQEIARYVRFSRGAPWFFISLGDPGYACDSPGDWPNAKRTLLVYREALIPPHQK